MRKDIVTGSVKGIITQYEGPGLPRIEIQADDGEFLASYLIPTKSSLFVVDGERVAAGAVLARFPRPTTRKPGSQRQLRDNRWASSFHDSLPMLLPDNNERNADVRKSRSSLVAVALPDLAPRPSTSRSRSVGASSTHAQQALDAGHSVDIDLSQLLTWLIWRGMLGGVLGSVIGGSIGLISNRFSDGIILGSILGSILCPLIIAAFTL